MGHFLGHDDVQVDPKKIRAMKDWKFPKTLKSLRGFLGLTRYYRKFIRNYGKIVGPLTKLLKKNSFSWDDQEEQAFLALKDAMCLTPIIVVSYFSKPFVLECDVLATGLGAILTQEGRPLAFTNKQICDLNLGNSTYEKEMMTKLHVVDTWKTYLLGHHFKIKTYQYGLKYFLEQCLYSPEQCK